MCIISSEIRIKVHNSYPIEHRQEHFEGKLRILLYIDFNIQALLLQPHFIRPLNYIQQTIISLADCCVIEYHETSLLVQEEGTYV